jgi:dolichyl-phosphate-mannose-protein mannosyltransferase
MSSVESLGEHSAGPTFERAAAWLRPRQRLLLLFAVGLVVRLIIARYSEGLRFDLSLFREWSDRLSARGLSHFYEPGYFVDYPPGYLYVLFVLGGLWRALRGGSLPVTLLKLPAIVADIGTAVLAILLATRLVAGQTNARSAITLPVAGAILLNPALILLSAAWGQVDSVAGFLVLAGLYLAAAGRPSPAREFGGVGLLAIAVATKPQAAFALPLLGIVVVRRHLDGAIGLRARLHVAVRVGLLAVFAAAVIVAMFAPFGVSPAGIPSFYRDASSVYRFTSLWAFNVWGAAGFYRPDIGPGAVSLDGLAAYHLGLAAFVVVTVALMALGWRSADRGADPTAVAVFGAAAVTCAGFALLTRMHERYLYLALVTLAPLIAHRPFRRAFAAISVLFFLNLHFVYVHFSHSASPPGRALTIQPLYDALFGVGRDAWQLKAFGILTGALGLVVAIMGWGWLRPRVPADALPAAAPADADR